MAQVRIDFHGRGEVETFSWARVQEMGDDIQLALRVARQVGALGQILAQQPIGVLVGTTLPRTVRIGKEHPDRELLYQARLLGHLFAPILGQGFAQQRGHVPELLCEALSNTPRIRPVHPGQDDQARRPLHQGPAAEPLRPPLRRLPSQWPGTVRSNCSHSRAEPLNSSREVTARMVSGARSYSREILLHEGEHEASKLFLCLPVLFALTGPRLSRQQHERAIGASAEKCLFDRRQFRIRTIRIASPIDVIPEDSRDVPLGLIDEGAIRRQRNRFDPQICGDGPLVQGGSGHPHKFFPLLLRLRVRDVQLYSPAVRRSIGPHK